MKVRNGFGNGLAAIDDSKFGVKPPKRGFGVKWAQKLYQSRARLWFAYINKFRTSICNGLATIDDSKLGVWGKTPKRGFGVKPPNEGLG